uniref:HAP1 N-terminal domain-containing protein n=1 Tax=Angiostrongylus cantonensis TaxID=6313 RepID=A0A0K0DPZ3_ANGCA
MVPNVADSVSHSSEDSRKVIQLYAALNAEKQGYISVSLNEMLNLLEQMERLRVAWKAAEEKAMYYEQSHAKVTMELESVSAQLRRCNAELKDARAQVVSQLDEVVALRADNEELLQRFQIVKEVLKSDIEQLPPESRNQLAFLRNPDLGRSNSKRVARRLYMEEEETGEAMEHDFSENTLDTMDDDIGHGR